MLCPTQFPGFPSDGGVSSLSRVALACRWCFVLPEFDLTLISVNKVLVATVLTIFFAILSTGAIVQTIVATA
jgi:hypothetical protein